jgi:hypothetical protein
MQIPNNRRILEMPNSKKSKLSSRTINKPKKKSLGGTNTVPLLTAPNRIEAAPVAAVQSQALQTAAATLAERGLTRRDIAKSHADVGGHAAYMELCEQMSMPPEWVDAAGSGSISFQREMRPKDGLEELALDQLLLAHTRSVWLTRLLAHQKDMQSIGIISEACERAVGTFARLMRAISEYRRPSNASTTVSIGQANVGGNQVVQNLVKEGRQKQKNGERTRISQDTAASTPALSANEGRIALPSGGHSANPALDKEHGPDKRQRKGASTDECTPSRPTVSRHHYAAKASGKND